LLKNRGPLPAAQAEVQPPAEVEATERVDGDGRIILPQNITPQFLIGLFADVTTVQGERHSEPYIGKWLRLTGKISNVSFWKSGRACVSVKFQALTPETISDFLTTTLLYFDRDHERLEVAQIGDQITALGRITEIGRFDLTIEDCEIVALGPSPQS
jgi:hypothetical protein